MTSIPMNSVVVVWIDPKNGIMRVATNVDPGLKVIVQDNEADFLVQSVGLPYVFHPLHPPHGSTE